MRFFSWITLLLFLAGARGAAADGPAAAKGAPAFTLPELGDAPAAPKFSDAQMGFVQSWIKQEVPECPAAVTTAVAEKFLEDLQVRQPQRLDQLGTPAFPARNFAPSLLRLIGTKLTGADQSPLREEVARRRVLALLALESPAAGVTPAAAAALAEKVRDDSPGQYRRLVEGRMEDDDLELMVRKARQPAAAATPVVRTEPKALSATDILAEFQRHNQSGAALQRLHAFSVDARLTNVTGKVEELMIFKMRPDRFRLVVSVGGSTRYVLAADGSRCWQQTMGQAPQTVPVSALGERRYLSEFADPLMAPEGYVYERLPDADDAGRKLFRLAVKRADGSHFVARIDPVSFQEIARENSDDTVTRYSDFHEIAGVTFAFREEFTDRAGRIGVLQIKRITPNPGLIGAFFTLPSALSPGFFEVERLLAATPGETPGPKG